MPRRSQRYDDAFAAVRAVVDELDPIALLAGGAPSDEYDPEVGDLVLLVLRRDHFDEAAVDHVWRRWFGDDYSLAGSEVGASLTTALQLLQRRFSQPT